MTTYTVLDPQGMPIGRELSIEDAAHKTLTYDGWEYEIRPADDGWTLWTRKPNRPGKGEWQMTRISSGIRNREHAHLSIYAQAIEHSDWWGMECMADEAYAAMLADQEGQEDEA